MLNLIEYAQLLILGAIAGFTIFLGFPVALADVSPRTKAFLNSVAIGILVFLVVDVFGHAWGSVTGSVANSLSGAASPASGAAMLATMFIGIALGLVGLAYYEKRYMRSVARTEAKLEQSMAGKDGMQVDRYRLATMIAIGIGAHNLSEGLAIGQSYAAGAIGLALILIVGFGAHNATEGFGIMGPLAGGKRKVPIGLLIKLGLVGGGPTFIGTLLGSVWVSPVLYLLFLSFAGGALVFVILLMYSVVMKQTSNSVITAGILLGLIFGFLTDLIVTLGGA